MVIWNIALLIIGPGPMAPAVVPVERITVSLAMANKLTAAAISSCRAIRREAVVAVVDRGGNLIALQRGDDIGPHNTLAAQRKAFTALSTKTSTGELAGRAAADPASRNLVTVPELLLLGGGLPLVVDGDVAGGIGVAGSGGAANDELCAKGAITKVLGSLNPIQSLPKRIP
ncbi:heme-binding protein [Sphingomonas sp. S1-29]|uniref:GlcG/HbpS family heme-binding protein n=1 Tax=Sphingomonas sp. S1-29 TaxID=2991074 RepID=UPI00224090A4|nr:heme-binding protein [Sphingomonas sp. S1-29]UZK68814.1 heme-binding protein [Sphingomonas sp. S1-29]